MDRHGQFVSQNAPMERTRDPHRNPYELERHLLNGPVRTRQVPLQGKLARLFEIVELLALPCEHVCLVRVFVQVASITVKNVVNIYRCVLVASG